MKRQIRTLAPLAVATLLLSAGCGGKGNTGESESEGGSGTTTGRTAEAPGTPGAAISEARAALSAGKVDDAAAKLAQLQAQGATFNANQAKDYRQALSEAYDQAVEGAQRGDPKAQAALQLLRAAAPR